MAGMNDVVRAAFEGGQPGPEPGTDINSPSALNPAEISSGEAPQVGRPGADLIFDALGGRQTPRRVRAINRRRAQNG